MILRIKFYKGDYKIGYEGVGAQVMAVMDGNKLRKSSSGGTVLVVVDGNNIRKSSSGGTVLAVVDGNNIREKSSGGTIISTMDKIRKEFKDAVGGHALVAFWVAFIR